MRKRRYHNAKRSRTARTARPSGAPTAPGTSATSPTSATSTTPAGPAHAAKAPSAQAGRLRLRPWWERIPGRLEYEQARLDEWGVRWEIDPDEFSKGILVIRLWVQIDGYETLLAARFPDTYPYTRFEVIADSLSLDHHQNPFLKNLCLLGQATENWKTEDTLAGLLQSQLQLVLQTARTDDPGDVVGLEEAQGEPLSAYYTYGENTSMLIDGDWSIDPELDFGVLRIGIVQRSNQSWVGAVIAVEDGDGRTIAAIDPQIQKLFPKVITGRWIRTPRPVIENEPNKFLEKVLEIDASLRAADWRSVSSDQSIDIVGVIQPEELAPRSNSDGWVFFARHRFKNLRTGLYDFGQYLVFADRVGRRDLASRIPELVALSRRKVALIGAGCIGAPSALHFARGSVSELRLVDGDAIEAGPTVRWPLGLESAGMTKVDAVADFIRRNYPYTDVSPYHHRIGIALTQKRRDDEVLAEIYDGADLIFDASAELGIQHLLSDLAREYQIPYICIWTTPGGWGGAIVRIRPGLTEGCWTCLQCAFDDGSIPLPPQDSKELVQPAGCSRPTFLAASFDVEEISLQGVRLAVSTLSEGVEGGYPESEWDVAIVSLRDAEGTPFAPKVETFSLDRNRACQNHPD